MNNSFTFTGEQGLPEELARYFQVSSVNFSDTSNSIKLLNGEVNLTPAQLNLGLMEQAGYAGVVQLTIPDLPTKADYENFVKRLVEMLNIISKQNLVVLYIPRNPFGKYLALTNNLSLLGTLLRNPELARLRMLVHYSEGAAIPSMLLDTIVSSGSGKRIRLIGNTRGESVQDSMVASLDSFAENEVLRSHPAES